MCFCLCPSNLHNIFRISVHEDSLCPSRILFLNSSKRNSSTMLWVLTPHTIWKWWEIYKTSMNKSVISFYVYCLFLSLELVSCKVITSHVFIVYKPSPPVVLFCIHYICYFGIYFLFWDLCWILAIYSVARLLCVPIHQLVPFNFLFISAEFFPRKDKPRLAKSYFHTCVIIVIPFKTSNELCINRKSAQ
jgi:hypothetical protein